MNREKALLLYAGASDGGFLLRMISPEKSQAKGLKAVHTLTALKAAARGLLRANLYIAITTDESALQIEVKAARACRSQLSRPPSTEAASTFTLSFATQLPSPPKIPSPLQTTMPPTEADIIFSRASVTLAKSQRLIASWLPPLSATEFASAKTDEEIESEEREMFAPVPELYVYFQVLL